MKCPLCGTPCKIEGKTTLHYEPINSSPRLERLDEKKLLSIYNDVVKKQDYPSVESVCHKFIKIICQRFGSSPAREVPSEADIEYALAMTPLSDLNMEPALDWDVVRERYAKAIRNLILGRRENEE